MRKETEIIIKRIEKKYNGDIETKEIIEKAKADIEYIEKKEAEEGYAGQSSNAKALELEAFLNDWY